MRPERQADDARRVDDVLCGLPHEARISALLVSLLGGFDALRGAARLIAITLVIARQMPPAERALVAELLHDEAESLGGPLH
jgi:hypothetical protein